MGTDCRRRRATYRAEGNAVDGGRHLLLGLFVKVNFAPYLAIDLLDSVHYERSLARFDQRDGKLHLTLPKVKMGHDWPRLKWEPDGALLRKIKGLQAGAPVRVY